MTFLVFTVGDLEEVLFINVLSHRIFVIISFILRLIIVIICVIIDIFFCELYLLFISSGFFFPGAHFDKHKVANSLLLRGEINKPEIDDFVRKDP